MTTFINRHVFVNTSEMRDQPPLKKRKLSEEKEFGTFQEVLQDANPYNFLLTKVKGIPDKFNNKLAVHIKGTFKCFHF